MTKRRAKDKKDEVKVKPAKKTKPDEILDLQRSQLEAIQKSEERYHDMMKTMMNEQREFDERQRDKDREMEERQRDQDRDFFLKLANAFKWYGTVVNPMLLLCYI